MRRIHGSVGPTTYGLSEQLEAERSIFAAEEVSFLASSYEQDVARAPSMVSVVARDRIEGMGARYLVDVLKSIPGLETSLHISGFDLVSVRGLQKDARVLLLVDGQPLNNPYDGRNYWNIPASHIERVEVIRGPGSALYGAGAFSAVVDVKTRKNKSFEAQLEAGSFDTLNGHPTGGGEAGRHQASFNTHVQVTGGPQLPVEKDALSGTGVERTPEDMRTHAAGLGGGLTGAYQGQFGPNDRTEVRGHLSLFGESRGPYVGYFDTVGPDSRLNWLLFSGNLAVHQALDKDTALIARVYGGKTELTRLFQLAPPGFSTPIVTGMGTTFNFSTTVCLLRLLMKR